MFCLYYIFDIIKKISDKKCDSNLLLQLLRWGETLMFCNSKKFKFKLKIDGKVCFDRKPVKENEKERKE